MCKTTVLSSHEFLQKLQAVQLIQRWDLARQFFKQTAVRNPKFDEISSGRVRDA